MIARRCPRLLLVAVLGAACADEGVPAEEGAEPALPAHCPRDSVPPATLECTGLYADFGKKQLGAGVRAYTPAVQLWSDGADKQRWIRLPPGTTIDATDPNEWRFPVGTRLWKQFSKDGRRIETRLWQKLPNGLWVHAVYAWSADETAAARSRGGDIPFGTGTYHIPTQDECEKCHRGRTEHILGFDQVALGLPGAAGVTLADLVAEGRLKPAPARTHLTIGDDGTGAAGPALGWLHANCGTTCHNGNSVAIAFGAKMRLRLDPGLLDGRPLADIEPRTTTIGVRVNAPGWAGRVRIVPGDPDGSLLYDLISHRGMGKQMPPFATNLVDRAGVALVGAWIRSMPRTPGVDAGPVDAPMTVDAADAAVTMDARDAPVNVDAPDAGFIADAADAAIAVEAGDAPGSFDGGIPGDAPDAGVAAVDAIDAPAAADDAPSSLGDAPDEGLLAPAPDGGFSEDHVGD